MTIGTMRRHGGVLVALLFLAGCASGGSPARSGAVYGAQTPENAVRGFLDGVNNRDYRRMGELFGTKDGPAERRFGVADIEQRMVFLGALLRHDSYQLRQADLAQLGPDRVRFLAAMTGTRKGDVTVAIVTVPTRDNRWFVEQLNVDALTGKGAP